MALPQFNLEGDLLIGIHPATLEEVKLVFGTTTHRRSLVITRLKCIYRDANETQSVAQFIIFGSLSGSRMKKRDGFQARMNSKNYVKNISCEFLFT